MRFQRQKIMAVWLVILAVVTSTDGYGSACGPYGCPPQQPTARMEEGVLPRTAIVRVNHQTAQGASSGTATLISHGEAVSYFVTCSHLFDDGPGRTEIASKAIGRLSARIVARDRGHDLVLLETRRCQATPATVAEVQGRSELTACGFGPTGLFRCVRGAIVGYATPQGATSPSLRIRGAVRPGDSGGPVFDRTGRLVAVIWGERRGETYATFGGPLRRLLSRLPRRQPPRQPRLVPVERIPVQRPILPAEPTTPPSILKKPNVDHAWREGVDRRLAANESAWRAMDLSPFAKREELRTATSSWGLRVGKIEARLHGVMEKTTELAKGAMVGAGQAASAAGWMAPLLSALGIGGPIGVALVAGHFLIRRRANQSRPSRRHSSSVTSVERPIAVDTPPPPQQVVPETHYVSYERDEYAKAHQWASEQLARKFPGSVEMLTSLDSLIRQQLAGSKKWMDSR